MGGVARPRDGPARTAVSKGCSAPITTSASAATPQLPRRLGDVDGARGPYRRIRLGTLVSPATFRHPSVLAKTAAYRRSRLRRTDRGGNRRRLVRGSEHRAYGFEFPALRERLDRFAEQLEIVHRQWTEPEPFDFEGRSTGSRAAARCRARCNGRIRRSSWAAPAAAGRSSPAVRLADEYNTIFASPELCRERRQALTEACERAGRDPASITFSLMTPAVVGVDEPEVSRRLQAVRERSPGFSEGDAVISGTVDRVVERLREYEAAGVERVMLQHLAHEDVEMVLLVGAEVAPRVA